MPPRSNWLLFLLNIGFVICGAFVLPSDPNVGIVTIAFFGSCAAVAGVGIARKLWPAPAPERISIVGGVPIRPSRLLLGSIGAWLAVLGTVLLIFGWSYGVVFRWTALAILVPGCYLLVAVIARWLPATYLQFDPEGITFGHRGFSYLVRFDNLAGIAAAEMNRNPVLLMQLHQPDLIEAKPPASQMRALKQIARCDRWHGVHIVVLAVQYRLDPALLAQALDRYINEPSARDELSVRSLRPSS